MSAGVFGIRSIDILAEIEYTYSDGTWKDLLTQVGSRSISYDAQGNPVLYFGHSLTWEKGRQLKSFGNITYTYNANGIRTSKTVVGTTHKYTLDGTKILRETWGNNTLVPMYDNEDSVCGIIYNNEPYYFQKNLQGDVIGIVDRNANVVATYTYDAWGECISNPTGIAAINPFRYRGYYYDSETGMYYLQSRYYDPTVGRFLCADQGNLINIGGNNLFSYCCNSPIMICDYSGKIPQAFILVASFVWMLIWTTFPLSVLMYAYAATGSRIWNNIDISSWWNPIGNAMKKRLENSRVIGDRIRSYIWMMRGASYTRRESVYFSPRTSNVYDLDLAFSVGHAKNCRITVQRTGQKKWFSSKRKYIVTIELSDWYDFDKFNAAEKGIVITFINNLFGYYPMMFGILRPYWWRIKHTFDYYY